MVDQSAEEKSLASGGRDHSGTSTVDNHGRAGGIEIHGGPRWIADRLARKSIMEPGGQQTKGEPEGAGWSQRGEEPWWSRRIGHPKQSHGLGR